MLRVFSIKDVKADAFLVPFFTHNRATAEREFRRLVGDPQSMIYHNPSDYQLYEVGIWNDEVGVILSGEADTGPVFIISADSIRNLEVK